MREGTERIGNARIPQETGTPKSNGRGEKLVAVMKQVQSVPAPTQDHLFLRIVGEKDIPLIVHKMSEKARSQMRDKHQQKETGGPRPPKDPSQECIDGLHRLPGKDFPKKTFPMGASIGYHHKTFGFPSSAFKKALIFVAKDDAMKIDGRKIQRAVHCFGTDYADLVTLEYERLTNVEADVVNANGQPDLRYRGQFYNWSAILHVQIVTNFIAVASVLNLFGFAGMCCGVGQNRPGSPKNAGVHGVFHVEPIRRK